MSGWRRQTQGVGMIWAIALLVLLASLGITMLRLRVAQSSTAALDVVGAQAFWAAQAGAEWGVGRLTAGFCDGDAVWILPIPAGVVAAGAPMAVRVQCSGSGTIGVVEGNQRICRYTLTVTACAETPLATPTTATQCPATGAGVLQGGGYVERRIVHGAVRTFNAQLQPTCP
ncbi:MAG: hypothetical protein N2557_07070 [Hydrogenophilus sp.]|nr:hypothetical protein [Hydrogenophilus sp.]